MSRKTVSILPDPPIFNLTFRRGPKVKQEPSCRGDFDEEKTRTGNVSRTLMSEGHFGVSVVHMTDWYVAQHRSLKGSKVAVCLSTSDVGAKPLSG